MTWNTKNIEGMEQTAREEADCNCNTQINGKWLEVVLHERKGPVPEKFSYLYNGKQINRETAIQLLAVGR